MEVLEARTVLSFVAPVNYDVGAMPEALVTADFDVNGTPDLATADRNSASVSVLLGNADGSFQSARRYTTDAVPEHVIVGDFNRDGRLDLATAHSLGMLNLLLGNGDGTFQPARDYSTGASAQSLGLADFNFDGLIDIVVGGSGGVRVLKGNGDGTFQLTTRSYGLGGVVTVSDFNFDGLSDVAVVSNSYEKAMVLLNTGVWDGSAPGGAPGAPGLGSFPADGLGDVAALMQGRKANRSLTWYEPDAEDGAEPLGF